MDVNPRQLQPPSRIWFPWRNQMQFAVGLRPISLRIAELRDLDCKQEVEGLDLILVGKALIEFLECTQDVSTCGSTLECAVDIKGYGSRLAMLSVVEPPPSAVLTTPRSLLLSADPPEDEPLTLQGVEERSYDRHVFLWVC